MENTNKDGRKISPKAMEEIRIRAVQRVQAGESPEDVIKTFGFPRACIYNWLGSYRNGGWHALRVSRKIVKGPGQLKSAVARKLCNLQKIPRIIASFFRHPDCLYTRSFVSK